MTDSILPETMRAVVLHEHGGPEVLKVEDVPRPTPGPGEVCIRVRAVALNRLDLWVRGGLPGLRLEYPHRLGSDMGGEVVELGAGVDAKQLGREVLINPGYGCGSCEHCLDGWDNLCRFYKILGENTQGGYGQYAVVPAANLLPRPAGMSWTDAAAIPLTFLTAWQMLVVRAQVRAGDVVLMHAAGSGVGSAGLQIAKLHGAKVVALASTQAKLDKAKELGADDCICSADEDWEAQVRALPYVGKRGVDIVFEHVGEATWERSIRLTRKGGAVVTCGASSGYKAKTDLRQVFFRQIQILGSTMGSRTHLHRILKLVDEGRLQPVVDRVFKLDEAADAHRYLDRREQFGKVVLEVD